MKNNPPNSLKKRLLIWISVPVILAGVLISLMAFFFSWKEIDEVYDAQLVHSAKVLLQMTEHAVLVDNQAEIMLGEENASLKHHYENKTAFRIWYKDRLITQSNSAKKFGDLEASPGFSNQVVNNKEWRFFVFIDSKTNLKVETSERISIRHELITQLMSSLITPILLFLPMLLLVIWFVTKISLKPLVNISNSVDSRHADDLTAIISDDIPTEAQPLIDAINRLLNRIFESFKREREFTDHAAHELRTPLAALKTQTQVLMKKSASFPELHDGLDNLNSTIDRSTHLVEQLLSFARLQNEILSLQKTDLSECLRQDIHDLEPLIKSKNQTLVTEIAEDVIIQGHEDTLSILLRNLIDNAIKYTPENGLISISLSKDGLLQIKDTGTGLSDENKERVFRRFIRADKSGQTGSGLGLSIAEWVATGHGVKIALNDNQPSGLIVRIQWNHCYSDITNKA